VPGNDAHVFLFCVAERQRSETKAESATYDNKLSQIEYVVRRGLGRMDTGVSLGSKGAGNFCKLAKHEHADDKRPVETSGSTDT
jgi:hypothetical protein